MPSAGAERRVRVVIADDEPDMRRLLNLSFMLDDRFEVVGEAVDGRDTLETVRLTRPDLLVLDRQMPVMDGVTALPEVRRISPHTAVVVYTAAGDQGAYQAALAAGAVGVLDKADAVTTIVDELAEILVRHWAAPDATVEVRVGPIPAAIARYWVANTKQIVAAVRAHPEVLHQPVPEDVLDTFDTFLRTWGELAEEGDDFRWFARASTADVERLVENWSAIDNLDDGQLEQLGVHWSGPAGEPFFRALVDGVLEALAAHDELENLARRLSRQWNG